MKNTGSSTNFQQINRFFRPLEFLSKHVVFGFPSVTLTILYRLASLGFHEVVTVVNHEPSRILTRSSNNNNNNNNLSAYLVRAQGSFEASGSHIFKFQKFMSQEIKNKHNCKLTVHTVDGSEIRLTVNQLRLENPPLFTMGFSTIPGGCLGFLNHQQ